MLHFHVDIVDIMYGLVWISTLWISRERRQLNNLLQFHFRALIKSVLNDGCTLHGNEDLKTLEAVIFATTRETSKTFF